MRAWILFLFVSAIYSGFAYSADFGEVHGTINNPNGTNPPWIDVVLRDVKTGAKFTAISDEQGRYAFYLLSTGKYSISLGDFPELQNLGRIKIANGKTLEHDINVPEFYHLIGGCQVLLVSQEAPICCGYHGILETVFTPRMLKTLPTSSRSRTVQGVLEMTGGVTMR